MALTNTGGSRNQSITIQTLVNGVVTSTVTYWITQDTSELQFRYLGNVVTETDLQTLPEGDHEAPVAGTYADLLAEFKAAVEALYTGLDIDTEQSNEPYSASNVSCPITVGGGGAPA